jgi:hypothetical protein
VAFEIEALGGGNGLPLRLMEADDALVVPASNGESAVWTYLKGIELCGAAGSSAHDLNLAPRIPLPQSPGLRIETWGTRFCGE